MNHFVGHLTFETFAFGIARATQLAINSTHISSRCMRKDKARSMVTRYPRKSATRVMGDAAKLGRPTVNTVFFGNLPYQLDSGGLRNEILRVGTPTFCQVARHVNGTSRGFAFVSFADLRTAYDVIDRMDSTFVGNRRVAVHMDTIECLYSFFPKARAFGPTRQSPTPARGSRVPPDAYDDRCTDDRFDDRSRTRARFEDHDHDWARFGDSRRTSFDDRNAGRPSFDHWACGRTAFDDRTYDRVPFADQYSSRTSFDNRRSERPSFDDRRGERPSFDDRARDRSPFADQGRAPFDDRRNERPSFDDRAHERGGRAQFDDRGRDRPSFDGRGGDRRTFDDRGRGFDDGRSSFGDPGGRGFDEDDLALADRVRKRIEDEAEQQIRAVLCHKLEEQQQQSRNNERLRLKEQLRALDPELVMDLLNELKSTRPSTTSSSGSVDKRQEQRLPTYFEEDSL
jgi:RNA recognition motif-containing protein